MTITEIKKPYCFLLKTRPSIMRQEMDSAYFCVSSATRMECLYANKAITRSGTNIAVKANPPFSRGCYYANDMNRMIEITLFK